jgi:hypothetical protein
MNEYLSEEEFFVLFRMLRRFQGDVFEPKSGKFWSFDLLEPKSEKFWYFSVAMAVGLGAIVVKKLSETMSLDEIEQKMSSCASKFFDVRTQCPNAPQAPVCSMDGKAPDSILDPLLEKITLDARREEVDRNESHQDHAAVAGH